MIKKTLFYVLVILSVLACCLATLRFARAEPETPQAWATVGKSIQYCSGIGFHYEYFLKWEAAGMTLTMQRDDGATRPYFGKEYQYTCEVHFMSQPTHDGMMHAIGLDWKFFTPEAVTAWEELVEESNAYFCKHSKATYIHGFTKMTYPMGFVKMIDCENDTEES